MPAGVAAQLSGRTFGRLYVLKREDKIGKSTRWLCRCSCGNETKVITDNLLTGHTQSCGCLHSEATRVAKTKHGHSPTGNPTSEYTAWKNMKRRCSPAARNKDRRNYYDRGILPCQEWDGAFQEFITTMGPMPPGMKKASLERIDVNAGYTPGNCKWIPMSEQGKNTRKNRRITYKGVTRIRSEWAVICGVKPSFYNHRIDAVGWSEEDALRIRPLSYTLRDGLRLGTIDMGWLRENHVWTDKELQINS